MRATAIAAIGGIATGVAALIIALALANGFREEMRDKILHGTAHLTVMRRDGLPMQNYQDVVARIRKVSGVTSAAGTTYDGAVLSGPKGSAYAVLRGVDTESAASAKELKNWIIEGSGEALFAVGQPSETSQPAIVLGSELVTRTGLRIGDSAEILPATTNGAAVKRVGRVAGIFRSGLFEYDAAWIYLSLKSAAAFTGNFQTATLISVDVANIDDVKNVARSVNNLLGPSYTTVDWQEANRPLFTALALERRMGLFIVGLIILIAMLNIMTMLILVVIERRRDIAILKAMGAAKASITAVFIIEGAIIGVMGAVAGVAMAIVACVLGNRYKIVSLPADVYSIGSIPFRPHLTEILFVVVIAFFLSVIATIYPARAAANLFPADSLRDAG